MKALENKILELQRLLMSDKSKFPETGELRVLYNRLINGVDEAVALFQNEDDKFCERLSDLIMSEGDDYETIDEAFEILKKQNGIDGSVMADYHVDVTEASEYSFTVSSLLDAIGYNPDL